MSQAEMAASDRLARELSIAADAAVGIIAIRCPETEVYRVVDEIYFLAQTQEEDFRMHTVESGWQAYASTDLDDPSAEPFDPLKPTRTDKPTAPVKDAFAALYSEKLPNAGYFVMLDLYFTFGDMATQTHVRKQMQRSLNIKQRLFLVVPQTAEIPEALAPLMHVIDYGYPSRSELRTLLDDFLSSITANNDDDDFVLDISDEDRELIAANGQGMSAHSFETAAALASTQYSIDNDGMAGFSANNLLLAIRDYKTQLLRKTAILELQEPVDEDDIGGLDLFKAWMHERKRTYETRAQKYGATPSRGGLVVGVPGSGKSLVAKAAGSILGLPVIRFDIGKVFGQYMGQSEQAMRSALAMIDAMAPVVLMLDEIDKGFGGVNGGGGDSGTLSRVFGTMLTWMQERDQLKRPIFMIMTANRVQGLPPELLRRGRIDEAWAVGAPNEHEISDIISIHARKRGQKLSGDELKTAAKRMHNLVGAEIEAVIEDALVLSLADKKPGLKIKHIEKAMSSMKPMAETRADEFKAMAEWARDNARNASSPLSHVAAEGGTPRRGRGLSRPRAKVTRRS